ncbi:MAG: serine/threonine-protein phosphatase [Planctomycetes bacterium]|nr:serine/threonine-protein phosphatase [Planctomycetota bacterium]
MSEASVSLMTSSSGSASTASPPPPFPLRLLVLTDRDATVAHLRERLDPAWATVAAARADDLSQHVDADAVLIDIPPDDPGALARALAVVASLRDSPVPALALDGSLPRDQRIALYRAGVLACLGRDEDAEELVARIESLLGTKRTVAHALRRLREHTRHLDEQLRLAQRLQRDFLPRRMPVVENAQFAARLEPAAWVAGDFYDIFRLDEHHLGFYVADAVGHGIPAALLTVFVKKSLQTKRIEGKRYELISPQEALRLLNVDLLSAELQETPFITMVYGVYNEATRELVYARAGHPKPILLGPQGSLEKLDAEGPLLGIFADATFEARRRTLEPGQRLLLYTDGAERVEPDRRANPERLLQVIQTSSLLPIEALLDAVLDAVRGATGGHHLADDVTLVALELDPADPVE